MNCKKCNKRTELIGRREGTRYFLCPKCDGIMVIKNGGKGVYFQEAPTIMGRLIPPIRGPHDIIVEDDES